MSFKLHNFKPVSKAQLHKLIGLQQNYKILDIPSACKDCIKYEQIQKWDVFPDSKEYKQACSECNDCPYKKSLEMRTQVSKEVAVRYVNEKNKYGNGTPLKLFSILLFLYYNLHADTRDGMLKNINVTDIATALNCTVKTIIANNKILCKNGYIYHSNALDKHCINIYICNYKDAFLPVSQGGRGYYTISDELFHELVKIRNTNLLRITLKQLLEFDEQSLSIRTDQTNNMNKSYTELRRYLPSYCRPSTIKKALKSTAILQFDIKKDYVSILIDEKYNSKHMKKEFLDTATKELSILIPKISNETKNATTIGESAFTIPFFKYKRIETYIDWTIDSKHIQDLANLAVCYSVDLVLYALSEIYATYLCQHKKYKNLGGLVRCIITNYLDKQIDLLRAAV